MLSICIQTKKFKPFNLLDWFSNQSLSVCALWSNFFFLIHTGLAGESPVWFFSGLGLCPRFSALRLNLDGDLAPETKIQMSTVCPHVLIFIQKYHNYRKTVILIGAPWSIYVNTKKLCLHSVLLTKTYCMYINHFKSCMV